MSKPKNPRTPPPLQITETDIRLTTPLLWRIYKTSGPHPSPWGGYRSYGPLATMRWDPHPLPAGDHPDRGVLYAATDLRTAVAEVFQSTKRIDPYTGDPHVATFIPTRPLRLLSMYSSDAAWLLRHDASHSLMHGPKSTCRNWARAIAETGAPIDGLYVQSTMTGQATTVLFPSSATKLPPRPRAAAALAAGQMLAALDDIAASLGPRWRFAAPGFLARP